MLAAAWLTLAAPAQANASPVAETAVARWLHQGAERLLVEDPIGALLAYRLAVRGAGDTVTAGEVGLGRAHLLRGDAMLALAYAESALRRDSLEQDGMALAVRALIRARSFDAAVDRASSFVARCGEAGAELLAARGSALFRVQRIEEAAAAYQRVVLADPRHAEAHLRLGSGLLAPREIELCLDMHLAVRAFVAGEREHGIDLLLGVLQKDPTHSIAHRLLGEALFNTRADRSMASTDAMFQSLHAAMPPPDVRGLPAAAFVAGYDELPPARRRVVDRTLALFGRHLPRLVAIGGRHDLLRELERTTDDAARANLRGRRTFDGRVWDDVRGVGGVRAATGIEALDEAAALGFDTFAHEVAHQVHFFALSREQGERIRTLYQRALAEGRCLDFYAASNHAEYFAQGVEAFVSFGKRPGGETTHGHTRFELYAVDPELHDFIATVVDYDPLLMPAWRQRLLAAAVGVALRCGRTADARVAASWLSPGETRQSLLAEVAAATIALESH